MGRTTGRASSVTTVSHLGETVYVLACKGTQRMILDARGMLLCCSDNPAISEQAAIWSAVPQHTFKLPENRYPKHKAFISKKGLVQEENLRAGLAKTQAIKADYLKLQEADEEEENGELWKRSTRVKLEPQVKPEPAAAAAAASSSSVHHAVKKELRPVKKEGVRGEDDMEDVPTEGITEPGDWIDDPVPFKGKKCAFIVGNNAYVDKKNVLINAVPDAECMYRMLLSRGFEEQNVKKHTDVKSEGEFFTFFDSFLKNLAVGDIVVIFYAGHAYVDNKSPHDFKLEMCCMKEGPKKIVKDVMVKFPDITKRLLALHVPRLWGLALIIDACRSTDTSRASGHTLGDVRVPLMPNQIQVFSCAPEETASDGGAADGNGLFTGALLRVMENRAPTTDFERIVREATFQVQERTKNGTGMASQSPWISSSINAPAFVV